MESADLQITLDVTCPSCNYHMDLFQDTDLSEEGWLIDQACPEGPWHDAHENFSAKVECPECHTVFSVGGINW